MPEAPNEAEFWQRRLVAVVQDQKIWQAELDRRRRTIEAQIDQLATGERNHATLEAVRQQLADQIEALRDVVADREREIGRLFGEVSAAHRQLHEVWSSFSWRATTPVRSISARLPGLARGLRNISGRYPGLWTAGAEAIRSAGRVLLLKSPAVRLPAPSSPEPLIPTGASVNEAHADALPAHFADAPHRPQSWLSVGGTIERLGEPPNDPETGGLTPVHGDHVLFAGASPTSPDLEEIVSLIERGIEFSLFIADDIPLEVEAAWLRIVLTHARCVFVPDASRRDRILRWAVLSDVYVSAAVELEAAVSDVTAARLEKIGPTIPLGQPGRMFLPGIVAPATLPALENAQAWCTEDDPQISILIVNRNAYPLTRACIQQIWANTSGVRYEIIIADRSSSTDRRPLAALGRGVRLLPVGADRFFGEACNVAVEHAQASLLCLLSNDCFVQPRWLTNLVDAIEADPAVGVAGPLLLSADMIPRDSGGAITERGTPAPDKPGSGPRSVDYVRAVALLVRRKAYLDAGGFDLMYEPESFEDVDFCFKLKTLELSVRSCPSARVIQVETDDDPVAEARREGLVELNRTKFVSRWGAFLRSRTDADLAAVRQQIVLDVPVGSQHDATLPTAVLYTPYPITPGGGERFLLTIASELMRDHRVTIVTPNPYSQLRLRNIAYTFDLDLSRCRMQTEAEFLAEPAPSLMVVLGNFVYPPIASRTTNAVFILQFPFPLEGHPPRINQGYRAVIAYSDYARTHILASMSFHGMPPWPVEIVHPPVPQIAADRTLKRPMVLTVGRFFTGGHTKRHDLMIDAFRRVLDAVGGEVEMHLAGSSTPGMEHLRYLDTLMRAAEGMPVTFHVNASRDTLEDLYRRATVYWHATGLGADLSAHPEQAEHFGISLVEAMSAECVSMAFDAGGPQEIVTPGVDGLLYASLDELVALTADILRPDAAERRQSIGRAAGERAKMFAPERFGERVREVLLP